MVTDNEAVFKTCQNNTLNEIDLYYNVSKIFDSLLPCAYGPTIHPLLQEFETSEIKVHIITDVRRYI